MRKSIESENNAGSSHNIKKVKIFLVGFSLIKKWARENGGNHIENGWFFLFLTFVPGKKFSWIFFKDFCGAQPTWFVHVCTYIVFLCVLHSWAEKGGGE